jgi:dephospho-CoA kinase/predicted DNA-binding ribbon-helix-helix protein
LVKEIETMEQQDRIMDGDLQTLGLQSILKMLALSEKTGKLFVSSGPETLSISLRKGQIVGLHEDGMPQPDLLGMLCLIKKLDPPRAQVIRELAQGNMQLALQMLVERGWMTAAEMQRRLEFAVTQSISHALRWVNGRFAFHLQILPLESKMQPLNVDSMLLEALRQADEWEEFMGEGVTHLTRSAVARWQPEVNRDVRGMGLNQESIEVLCLSNGELPLQAIALVMMSPEARVARLMARLLEYNLIEVVDTALETELQQDLSNIIIKCQYTLAQKRNATDPEHHLLGLITTLAECINGLLIHHGRYARSLRGRGHISSVEIVRYLERRFAQRLQMLARQQYPILETANFNSGQLDCNDILTLNKVVKGEQLEEFYWEAVQGLAAFLRIVFAELLRDEVGNSHIGRQLNVAWKIFLSEIDHEVQQYQVYRAHRNTQKSRGREGSQGPAIGIVQNWSGAPENESSPFWTSDTQRRLI